MEGSATAPPLLERIRQMPPWRLDAVLATLFVVTALLTTSKPDPGYEERDARRDRRSSSPQRFPTTSAGPRPFPC